MEALRKFQPTASAWTRARAALLRITNRFGWPAFLAALAVGVCLLTAMRISGTSVGMLYIETHGSAAGDSARLLGWPRGIRSDEYTVATAWTAAQAQVGYPAVNPLFGVSGQSLLFYDIPVKDFTLFFKPQHWGFLVLPLEQAFAFKWWFRAAFFLTAAGLLLLRISRGQALFSILGALGLFFMPHIQWWYSVTMLDIAAYSFLIFEMLIRLVRSRATIPRLLYGGVLAYLGTALVLLFYPPTQVSAGILLLVFGLVFLWRERREMDRARWGQTAWALALALSLASLALGAFYVKYQPVIQTIGQTVYPGQRVYTQAGFSVTALLSGVFNLQLLDEANIIPPVFGSSQTEAAGFFLYGLFLLPVLLVRLYWLWRRQKQVDGWGLALSLAFLTVLALQIAGLPAVFARLPVLSFLTTPRLLLPLGILNFLLIAWYLTRIPALQDRRFTLAAWVYGAAAGLVFAGLGLGLRARYPGFLPSQVSGLAIAAAAGLTCAAIVGQKRLLAALLMLGLAFFSSYKVNPLYQGLGELTTGQLVRAVREIDQADPERSRWILYENPRSLNLLQAGGAQALSGVYYSPDFALWQTLDPTGQFEDVYNRYSRVTFRAGVVESAQFELTSPDAFTVTVDPCSPVLTGLGVKYQVFDGAVPYACLREVRRVAYPARTFFIYERSAQN